MKMKPKRRADRADCTEFEAFLASRRLPAREFAALVQRNLPGWIRSRIARGEAGTRPPFVRLGEAPRLLRVLVHPTVGAVETHESCAALLHRLGLLEPEEEALYAAGELPREHCFLGAQAQRDPGVRVIPANEWVAMSAAARLAVVEGARDAGRAAGSPAALQPLPVAAS